MNGTNWLEGIFGTVRCANCGAAYAREDVTVVGNRDEYWFVRCSCHACGTQGIGVVIVKELSGVPAGAEAPANGLLAIGVDDVIAAHELLRDHHGDVHSLFGSIPGR